MDYKDLSLLIKFRSVTTVLTSMAPLSIAIALQVHQNARLGSAQVDSEHRETDTLRGHVLPHSVKT